MSEEATLIHAETSAQKKAGFALVSGDLAILDLLYQYRFLRREQISILTSRHPMSVYRRLDKLVEGRYITVIKQPLQKHVYGLGSKALSILVEQGIAAGGEQDKRLRTSELTELFFKHEMMLVDLHVMLTLASRKTDAPLELDHWQEGKELWDTVTFSGERGRATFPFRPDAFFSVIDRRRPGRYGADFFLEADRKSESHPVFAEKILAYWHYHEQRLHVKKFDIETFRVLTVTVKQRRADNLCQMTAMLPTSILPERARKYFLYTSLEALGNGDTVFGTTYHSAQRPSVLRELIAPPADIAE